MKKKFYRINQYIKADKVRVIDEAGKQIGILPSSKALELAQEKGIDLVEIAPNAKPPVCKFIEFNKFKYLEEKKKQEEKKKEKRVETKQLKLSPFMASNDFDYRIKRAEKFLKEGNKVKLLVIFKGRQITKKGFGYEITKRAIEALRPFSKIDSEPKNVGFRIETLLAPSKGEKNEKKQESKDKN